MKQIKKNFDNNTFVCLIKKCRFNSRVYVFGNSFKTA